MNAQMRRIDLFCKLIGPLSIALIDSISTDTAILVNFGMNVFSVVIEYYSIAKVCLEVTLRDYITNLFVSLGIFHDTCTE